MYQSESGLNPSLHHTGLSLKTRTKVSATVYFLGLTSLLTDISAEMVASILPIYLFTVLRLSPLEYGLVDGLYHGTTAIIRLASAFLADRAQRHKAVAFVGYLLSALSKAALLFAGFAGWLSVAAVILVDRVGKGMRTSPRDAMIAASSTPATLGTAFGVHRALDAVGAIIGPLLATGILLWFPKRFDYVFLVSLCFAIFGLLILGLFVRVGKHRRVAQAKTPAARQQVTLSATVRAIKAPRFMLLAGASTVLSLFTLTDNMIYIGLQRQLNFEISYMPLLFVATATVFMFLAIPMGRLADRYGPVLVFFIGYLMLAVVYCTYAIMPALGAFNVIFAVVLLGAYYAATDGVIAALAVKQLPAEIHTTGLACITTLISLGRMGSSILFGWIWESASQEQAVGFFGAAMVATLILTVLTALRLNKSIQLQAQ
jgi:MFS family permease